MFSGNRRNGFSIVGLVLVSLFVLGVGAADTRAQAVQSDDFHSATLNPVWTFVDPVGDAEFVTSGTNFVLRVPGGVSHTLWSSCNCAPRLLQNIANTDFQIQAKFDSQPSLRYQLQGFIVMEDADTYIRFDIHHDGTSPRIFAGTVDGINPPVTRVNLGLASVPPYLRVTRTGNTWQYQYSNDGSIWTTAGSFNRAIVVSKAGLFAGNSATDEYTTPAFVANADYFFNTASPIVPEDGGDPTAATPPVVDVWYGDSQGFGSLGNPQQWVNVVGTVWDAETIASLSYTLNGGPSNPLTVGPDGLRLEQTGDFNIDIDTAALLPGVNQIIITATDVLNEQRNHPVTVNYTSGVTAPLPYSAAFSTAGAISDAAQVVDGRWFLTGSGVRTDSSATGYDRYIALGDRSWPTNYEVTVPITVHAGNLGGTFGAGMLIGWQGHTGSDQPRTAKPYQALARISDFPANPTLVLKDNTLVRAQKAVTVLAGVRYLMKMSSQSVGIGLARVNVKFWQDGSPEPPAWDLTYDFAARSGSVVLVADHAEVTFGDVAVAPLQPLGVRSDDFSSTELDTDLWRVVDPLGDATLAMSGTNLQVYIPGGSKHTFSSTGVTAPRLLQDAPNADFEVAAGFGSTGHYTYQGQGIYIGEDADTYLRFEVIYTSGNPKVFAGYSDGGVLTTRVNTDVTPAPAYLKVKRIGNQWTFYHSIDGTSWTTAVTFTQAIAVTEAGVSFNNTATGDAYYETPAFVGNVDYFFNTSNPIAPEDGGAPTAVTEPVVELWYGDEQSFGELGTPQRWVNLPGNVWDSETVTSLSFSLNGGPSSPLGIGPDGYRLIGVGDFNVEIDHQALLAGDNDVVITATDVLGETRQHHVTIHYTKGITWEMPCLADFVSASKISEAGYVGDGRWTLTDGGIRTAVNGTGYDRFLLVGDWIWPTDYEVSLQMTLHAGNLGGITGAGIAIGWQGHITGGVSKTAIAQPLTDARYQTIAWIRNFPTGTILQLKDDETVRADLPVTVQANVAYNLKVRSETTGPGVSRVDIKFWQQGTAEPTSWMLSDNFTSLAGSVALIAHMADVSFSNVTVTPRPLFPLYTLDTTVDGGGSIVRLPDYASYTGGSTVKLTAVPDDGWLFDYWSGAVTGSANPVTVAMGTNKSVTAHFKKKQFNVTLWVSGSGTLTADPDTTKFLFGDTLILAATPDPGYYFGGWYGDRTGTVNPDTVIIEGDMKITAMFFGEITGIGPTPEIEVLTVLQNSPNPFRTETYLNVGLPRAGEVEIAVFDVAGRKLYSQRSPGVAGWNRFLFAGRDESGRALPSGVYFYQVRTTAAAVTNKLVILR
jgi:uncharacterized repeat protein (TIGR02543 family)